MVVAIDTSCTKCKVIMSVIFRFSFFFVVVHSLSPSRCRWWWWCVASPFLSITYPIKNKISSNQYRFSMCRLNKKFHRSAAIKNCPVSLPPSVRLMNVVFFFFFLFFGDADHRTREPQINSISKNKTKPPLSYVCTHIHTQWYRFCLFHRWARWGFLLPTHHQTVSLILANCINCLCAAHNTIDN